MKQSKKEMVVDFVKRYGYIIALSVIMVVVSIILILSANNTTQTGNNTPVVNNEPVSFYSPLLTYTVAKDYNDTSLVYNNTLKQWEAHKGICFTAAEGSEVFACLDGVVEDVYTNYLDGTVVVLKHNNNLKTHYSSLASDVKVKVGDTISKGSVIGKVSSTAANELSLGNHLHFEVTQDNVKIDPSTYLNLESK
jgi:murein DD-endopeptidase MepM/ murein hydrolase activator NlpD